jgi:sugar/nucleoside kinase (ribokinase family)
MTDYRLVYYSENRISAQSLDSEIEQILTASRRRNMLIEVSGALMFSTEYFAQVLEGSQAAIEATFERIQRDRRHGNVVMLDFAPAPVRSFQSWSMAFVGSADSVSAPISEVASRSGFDPRSLDGDQLFGKLRNLLNEQA